MVEIQDMAVIELYGRYFIERNRVILDRNGNEEQENGFLYNAIMDICESDISEVPNRAYTHFTNCL